MVPGASKSPIGLTIILVDREYTDGNCYKALCISPVAQGTYTFLPGHRAFRVGLQGTKQRTLLAFKGTDRTRSEFEAAWTTPASITHIVPTSPWWSRHQPTESDEVSSHRSIDVDYRHGEGRLHHPTIILAFFPPIAQHHATTYLTYFP